MLKVCKFGGSSLASAKMVGQVCDIVQSDSDRRIVVVSAPGKRDSDDTKVTDMLIACAESKLAGGTGENEMEALLARFAEIQKDLGLSEDLLDEISADLKGRLEADVSHKGRYLDCMKAGGEDNSAKLVAAELCRRGVDAKYLNPGVAGLLLSDEYGNAQLLPESYDNLAELKDSEGVIVFPGFFGHTVEGEVVTFPRGGSDITGSILAAAVKADEYENFTDVDSVFAVDPRIVSDVEPINELTYREMRELSYAGFGVFHDEAVVPAVQARIPIHIRSTGNPGRAGTMIVHEREHISGRVLGIASADGFAALLLSKYMMNREVGFGRRLLQILEEEAISYEHIPSGIDNISVIFKEETLDAVTEERLLGRIRDELGVENSGIERELALIMIVGEGMKNAIGVAAAATKAFSDSDVSIEMMNQGASEISMMFGVKAKDRSLAVSSLYKAFFNERQ